MADKKTNRPKIVITNRNPKKITGVTPLPKKTTGTPKLTIKAKPKAPTKKTPTPMPKPKIKKTPVPMPTTKSGEINPFKMTPQQKQEYLRNPERYSRG